MANVIRERSLIILEKVPDRKHYWTDYISSVSVQIDPFWSNLIHFCPLVVSNLIQFHPLSSIFHPISVYITVISPKFHPNFIFLFDPNWHNALQIIQLGTYFQFQCSVIEFRIWFYNFVKWFLKSRQLTHSQNQIILFQNLNLSHFLAGFKTEGSHPSILSAFQE